MTNMESEVTFQLEICDEGKVSCLQIMCFEHQGWAEQRKVPFPMPGAGRAGTEPT